MYLTKMIFKEIIMSKINLHKILSKLSNYLIIYAKQNF